MKTYQLLDVLRRCTTLIVCSWSAQQQWATAALPPQLRMPHGPSVSVSSPSDAPTALASEKAPAASGTRSTTRQSRRSQLQHPLGCSHDGVGGLLKVIRLVLGGDLKQNFVRVFIKP